MSESLTKKRPNIILINCDDLGYGDIEAYGCDHHTTPALNRMAEEGVRFTDFYMPAAVCSPSRAGMMTGSYPLRIGLHRGTNFGVLLPGDNMGLHPDEVTVADVLKDAGYRTKIIGKWHVGDQPDFWPTRHGFDEWFGIPYSNDMGRMVGREEFPPLPLMDGEDIIQEQPEQTCLTERFTESAVRFIRENKENPFFLYFAHIYVHNPIYAPKRFHDVSENGAFGAAVAHIDWCMAVLFDELKRQGLDENTLVVFTSDNGGKEYFGATNKPLRGEKGSTWEGGSRVPCMMRWPGTLQPGAVCDQVATAMDFLPTFAALSGGEVPTDRVIDGKDISELLARPGDATTPYAWHCYYRADKLNAIRKGDWKYHLDRDELYNLREDIGEQNNVAADHPAIVDDIKATADAVRSDIGDALTETTGANCRPCGWVDDPKQMTTYQPDHPYMIALYD
jgi:arylsulfatase A